MEPIYYKNLKKLPKNKEFAVPDINRNHKSVSAPVGFLPVPYRNKYIRDMVFESAPRGKKKVFPLPRPVYAFSKKPTEAMLRKTVLRAMTDLLTVPWYSSDDFHYRKTGPMAHKTFIVKRNELHAGIPYTHSGHGLFQFLEYYDQKTGRLDCSDFGKSPETIGQTVCDTLGGACGSACCYSLMTIGARINCWASPDMTMLHGFLPVGDYDYPKECRSYKEIPTEDIVRENGIEKMLECYALLKPADFLNMATSDRTDSHIFMVLRKTKTVYNENHQIDPDRSTVFIADQRGGGYSLKDARGCRLFSYGRTAHPLSFRFLFEHGFIPITSADYDPKKFQFPKVFRENDSVVSNYGIAVIRVLDKNGKVIARIFPDNTDHAVFTDFRVTFREDAFFCRNQIIKAGNSRSRLSLKTLFKNDLEVVICNGETFLLRP